MKLSAALLAALLTLFWPAMVCAALQLPAILDDHMVLQRHKPVPIWGRTLPGTPITVRFADQIHTVIAGETGDWRVTLEPMMGSAHGRSLSIEAGPDSAVLRDVLVGEVWLCTGQSNMQFGLRNAERGPRAIEKADAYPNLRLFLVANHVVERGEDLQGSWLASSPESAERFAAVGYFYGLELHQQLDVPIGLISSAWGATTADAWTPIEAIQADRALSHILDRDARREADRPRLEAEHARRIASWQAERDRAIAEGKAPSRKPAPPVALRPQSQASSLYNAMIHPLIPFSLRGVIWYQGESDVARADDYELMLKTLITSWREAWDDPRLSFGIVQLPNYRQPNDQPVDSAWASLREAQRLAARDLHDAGLAVTIDLGDSDNGHPPNKQPVALRLAQWALATVYRQPIASQGPRVQALRHDRGRVILTFESTGDLTTIDGEPPRHFAVQDSHSAWHWAEATIESPNRIRLTPPTGVQAKAARYAWADNPDSANLTDASRLPAGPFRIDSIAEQVRPHPRLLVNMSDFERLRALIQTDQVAGDWHQRLRLRAPDLLAQPVAKHQLRDGVRLLYESRAVMTRVQILGLLHTLNPDKRYIDRIWADLEAAAGFPDWNPAHFLDVAEMAVGFALAYDWLYDTWTEDQRAVIRQAIVRHALQPALSAYEDEAWWTTTSNNWNQVCGGGLILAALAVADEEPDLSARIIELCIGSLPKSMARYAPDGGYEEGPGYWSYGTTYNVLAIAGLESALGHAFGLAEIEGFDLTGSFPLQMTGPTGFVFNFADAIESRFASPALMYLARRYSQPAYARFAVERDRGRLLELIWYDPQLLEESTTPLPRSKHYEKVGVAMIRTAWGDPMASFLAVKGGTLPSAHGQLDLGSFVLETRGIRWFIDPGRDDYNLTGYFDQSRDGRRWHYYRNRAEGHNTLVINPTERPDQDLSADAPMVVEDQSISVDLSQVYGVPVSRTFTLTQDAATITDAIDAGEPIDLWWFAHTRACIDLSADRRVATLTQEGQTIRVILTEPAEAGWQIMAARPLPTSPDPAGQNPNHGGSLLNNALGSSFAPQGVAPEYGPADPDRAIRKLALNLQSDEPLRIMIRIETLGPSARAQTGPRGP